MMKRNLIKSKKTKSNSKPENAFRSGIENLVRDYFKENRIEDCKVAIACSAGIDSMSLLEAISSFYAEDLIHVVHLDHGWREDSYRSVEFLNKYCQNKKIKFHCKNFSYGAMNTDEETARDERYKFFNEICTELSIRHLFTAHNLNDNVETILFRLFRGTGSAGLSGIPRIRTLKSQKKNELEDDSKITVHRPFLDVKRVDIDKYITEKAIVYIDDPSNNDTDYMRNKIRNEILPKAQEINQGVLDNVMTLAKIITEEQAYLHQQTVNAIEQLGPLPWELLKFRNLHRTIQRKIFEELFTNNIRFCNQFLEAVERGGFHKINYAKGKFFVIKQKYIYQVRIE